MSEENKKINLTPDLFQRIKNDDTELEKIERPSLTFWQDAGRRLYTNKGARFAIIIILFLVFMALVGPYMNGYTYKEQIDPIRSHYKLPPRVPGLEKIGILDGTRSVEVGVNGLAAYNEGEYELVEEFTVYDEQQEIDVTRYKIKELTYIMQNVPDEYFWFGTDELGRDQWTRVWTGARLSLFIGLIAALIDLVVGVTYGAIAGYFGGKVDMILMRVLEVISGIPGMVIIIIFLLVFDPGIMPITMAIAITGWIGMARVVRSQFFKLKNQEFVLAARTIGSPDGRMIWKHFIPNILGQIIIMITFSIPSAIFYEAFLAFIGLGIPAPYASLGVLINDGYKLMKTGTYLMIVPSIVISLLMLSLNIFANGLRDAVDPKMKDM